MLVGVPAGVSAPVTILLTILNGFSEVGAAFGIVCTLFLVRMILRARKSEGLRAMDVLWKLGGLVAGTGVGLESILLGIGMGNLLLVVPDVADLALLSWWLAGALATRPRGNTAR